MEKLWNIVSIHLVWMSAVTYSAAQSFTSLDSIVTGFENEVTYEMMSFEEYAGEAKAEYEQYQAAATADFEKYVEKIRSVWGGTDKDDLKTDTKTEWVEYSEDYMSRSIVDFENGGCSPAEVLHALTPQRPIYLNRFLQNLSLTE